MVTMRQKARKPERAQKPPPNQVHTHSCKHSLQNLEPAGQLTRNASANKIKID